ncbi:hypothetical protein SAMN03159300_10476 [Janthinobacterium sp. 344]|uniref:hypothetical protein n=1 Tax=Janthinobacterium sp. 344 TaxID=1566280 RepID=UPI0008EB37CA|nr:hypothetical protein [Janthinobacterium sp. 344]SFB38950.1 hypothetical protein SAMN03159300_10476 [Janthinobacterium sp. 344]
MHARTPDHQHGTHPRTNQHNSNASNTSTPKNTHNHPQARIQEENPIHTNTKITDQKHAPKTEQEPPAKKAHPKKAPIMETKYSASPQSHTAETTAKKNRKQNKHTQKHTKKNSDTLNAGKTTPTKRATGTPPPTPKSQIPIHGPARTKPKTRAKPAHQTTTVGTPHNRGAPEANAGTNPPAARHANSKAQTAQEKTAAPSQAAPDSEPIPLKIAPGHNINHTATGNPHSTNTKARVTNNEGKRVAKTRKQVSQPSTTHPTKENTMHAHNDHRKETKAMPSIMPANPIKQPTETAKHPPTITNHAPTATMQTYAAKRPKVSTTPKANTHETPAVTMKKANTRSEPDNHEKAKRRNSHPNKRTRPTHAARPSVNRGMPDEPKQPRATMNQTVPTPEPHRRRTTRHPRQQLHSRRTRPPATIDSAQAQNQTTK